MHIEIRNHDDIAFAADFIRAVFYSVSLFVCLMLNVTCYYIEKYYNKSPH